MRYRIVLAFLFVLFTAFLGVAEQKNASATSRADVSGGRGQLVGTWRLISRVVTLEDGTAVHDQDLGSAPKGYLIYDPSGHMAVQLMRADRAVAMDCRSSGAATSDNSPQIFTGYEAYFGTYTIDESAHTVTHHLEGALAPADIGRNLVRQFQISGDKLTIVLRTTSSKEKQIRTLIWERVR